jgi:imidazole glycerol-phosphate synthase subunit HisH
MPAKVTIVDYGTGNLSSVKRSLDRLNVRSVVSSHAIDILNTDKIILPGVGHFATAMSRLHALNLIEPLNEAVLIEKKPVLGICLGMEVMARRSDEGNAEGLGWFDASIVRFNISNNLKYKVPHIGWNQIRIKKNSILMRHVPEGSEFYFVHSYYMQLSNPSDLLSETEYEAYYPSSVARDNIFGVQYHPEKSHDVGEQLLKNFVEL